MSIDRRRTSGYLPLRDAIDQLFAGSFIAPQYMTSGLESFPPTNMRITDDDVVISMAIPGANPNDINVSVTGDTVTVSGEVHGERQTPGAQGQGQGQQQGSQSYFEEIWSGRFQRTFTLPVQVDANQANASYENGILKLMLPKSEATKPRKIQVQSGRTIEGESQKTQSQTQGNTQTETVPVHSGSGSGQPGT